jgi:hypothetical protein
VHRRNTPARGRSRPIAVMAEHFGFTVEHEVEAAIQAIAGSRD